MTKQPVPKSAWVPAGVDPTDLDYPLQGPTVSGCLGKVFQYVIYALALYGLLALWQQTQNAKPPAAAQHDVLPTATPTVVVTVPVTWTPDSTPALRSDARPTLPAPTATLPPLPTGTPIPPGALATWTPGPWLLTRFAATYAARHAAPTVTATATPGGAAP